MTNPNSSPRDIINNFYEAEKHGDIDEAMDTKITVRLRASSASFFSALASRFNTTRFNIIQDVLDNAAKEMFCTLSPEDRAAIAAIADKETTEIYAKNGLTISTAGWNGNFENEDSTWRNFLTPEQIAYYVEQADKIAKELNQEADKK
jgi:hypothetical protein